MARTEHYNLVKPAGTERPVIADLNGNMDTIDAELYTRVKSFNGELPDENGNIALTTVPLANNLTSTYNTTSTGEFVVRTTDGAGSVEDGTGTLESIQGNSVREGYVPPVIVKTEEHATRTEDEGDIEVTIDDAAFLENDPAGGTITVTYNNGWSSNPAPGEGDDPLAWYGLTVIGTPKNGDVITIQYTEAVLGIIVMSTPSSFVSTGWNLYNHTLQCARVSKYTTENNYRYRIVGKKTSVKFSYTKNGTKTTITPTANGDFDVPDDGYVWVTGGELATTAIYAIWGDWANGYTGEFETYHESQIDLSVAMSNFPYGLARIGSYRDEINLSTGIATSVIERFEYDAETLASVKAEGRPYEYDSNYIYQVRRTALTYSVDVQSEYTMSDHGTELFLDTDVKVLARMIYGANLKNKLERDVLTISAQTLSDEQKAQVRENIGAADAELADQLSQVTNGMFLLKTYKYTVPSVTANGTASITTTNLKITDIEGYTILGVKRFSTGSHVLGLYALNPNSTSGAGVMTIKNLSSSAQSNKEVTLALIWVKTAAIG